MELPIAFEEKMKKLLKEEYTAYLESYQMPRYYGFRINTLKITLEEWKAKNPFDTASEVAWCKEGFYYTEEDRPAKNPYYYAGLYYIQEPSAMAPGAYIPIEKGDKVLDLCAAPGGKSTQVAARLGQTGVLVSNDISATRAKALLKNLENCGYQNVLVTNEQPERLATKCPSYFDKILIDAPCSGEGMFRKQPEAIKSWETHGVAYCCALQKEILEAASKMLKVGGMMLYSTCTFSPEENEEMIDSFLKQHPEFAVIPLEAVGGIKHAHPEWVGAIPEIEGALRLWPQHLKGEGHFVCLLQKNSGEDQAPKLHHSKKKIKDFPELMEFINAHTFLGVDTPIEEMNGKVYRLPPEAPDLKGLRVVRSGLLLGELKKKRFEPSQALALAYPKESFKRTIDLSVADTDVIRYLKGETLLLEREKGYHVICVDGYPLGWVKSTGTLLKNEYPPSWRMMG